MFDITKNEEALTATVKFHWIEPTEDNIKALNDTLGEDGTKIYTFSADIAIDEATVEAVEDQEKLSKLVDKRIEQVLNDLGMRLYVEAVKEQAEVRAAEEAAQLPADEVEAVVSE